MTTHGRSSRTQRSPFWRSFGLLQSGKDRVGVTLSHERSASGGIDRCASHREGWDFVPTRCEFWSSGKYDLLRCTVPDCGKATTQLLRPRKATLSRNQTSTKGKPQGRAPTRSKSPRAVHRMRYINQLKRPCFWQSGASIFRTRTGRNSPGSGVRMPPQRGPTGLCRLRDRRAGAGAGAGRRASARIQRVVGRTPRDAARRRYSPPAGRPTRRFSSRNSRRCRSGISGPTSDSRYRAQRR